MKIALVVGLDEFHSLKRIRDFETFITTARSKGGCVVLGFQNIESLRDEKCYGGALADTIVGECKNKMLFKAPSHTHAKWCADEFGESEFIKVIQSITPSVSETWGQPNDSYSYTRATNFAESADYQNTHLRMPSEFTSLPLPHQSGCFEAFAIVENQRLWRKIPMKSALSPLLLPARGISGLDRMPSDQERIVMWKPTDLERLRITLESKGRGGDLLNVISD